MDNNKPSCLTCKDYNEKCTEKKLNKCLSKSVCECCNGPFYHYPHGVKESRHCANCGAEWPVYRKETYINGRNKLPK